MPEEALQVVKAWGFQLKTMTGFTWEKQTKTGKDHFGMGHWTRQGAENALIAVKGKPRRVNASVRQVVRAPVGKHSEKPAEVRDRIVHLCGDLPRVELFARQATPGWHVFGNEVESTFDLVGGLK
jgi:N6-adenosine-specific RNA methylase IME4